MRSVTTANTPEKPVVGEILRCLAVQTAEDYALRQQEMAALTGSTQSMETVAKYSMIVWRVTDDSGLPVTDFDILILAGEKYDPDALPAGFFQNRQKNSLNANVLTYFVDHDLMAGIRDGKIGFRVVARPDEGFSWYSPCEFRSGDLPLSSLLRPNETLIVDIVLHRHVDRETFRLDGATQKGVLPRESFRRVGTSGVDVSAGTAQP